MKKTPGKTKKDAKRTTSSSSKPKAAPKKPPAKKTQKTAAIPAFHRCGTKGAPIGNNNACRHGLKGGKLPKDCKFIEQRVNHFRRQVETAVLAQKGDIDLPDAAAVNTACRWEKHSCLAHRWLVKQWDVLKPEELLMFSREIAKASSERDKALREIGLSRSALKTITLKDYVSGAKP
jgi:hypothetical protein